MFISTGLEIITYYINNQINIMALIKDYFFKTKQYITQYGDKTILLMQVGAFYEVYGLRNQETRSITDSNIEEYAQICELNISDKNICVGKNNVVMCGFRDAFLDKYLRKTQDTPYTIVVYKQDIQAKNTTRSLLGIFSPGTFFSSENQEDKISNNITCIWINKYKIQTYNETNLNPYNIIIGIGNVDIYTGRSIIFEFNNILSNDPTSYDELERFLSINNPNEIIIIHNLTTKEYNNCISFANINASSIHNLDLNNTDINQQVSKITTQTYQKEVLNKYFDINDWNAFYEDFYNYPIACQSYCYLLNFIYEHNPNLINKINEPLFENKSDRLILANHSLKQLNIITNTEYKGKFSSVVKFLNEAITPMGKRMFNYYLLNPVSNIDELNHIYDITQFFIDIQEKEFPLIRQQLKGIKDIEKLSRRIILNKISPLQIAQFYDNLGNIQELMKNINDIPQLSGFFNLKLQKQKTNNNDLYSQISNIKKYINTCVDIEICFKNETLNVETNIFKLNYNDKVDKEVFSYRDNLEILNIIVEKFNYLIEKEEKKSKTSDYIKIHETEKSPLSLQTTKRRSTLLKNIFKKLNGFINIEYYSNTHQQHKNIQLIIDDIQFLNVSTSNVSISCPYINDLTKNIFTLKNKMKDTLNLVYGQFIQSLIQFNCHIENIIYYVIHLDLLQCRTFIATKYNYCKPIIQQDATKAFVKATDLRHCLIERILDDELYVPNDIELGTNIDGILLYGTNAVGKTSLIKSLGISIIMAQAGLFTPASQFTYKPYNYIFTRILGNDNMFKGLSTFAVEMSELRTILKIADENSLILGDELCSGTESGSAISIFASGLLHLSNIRSSFLFATHFHEIAKMSEICDIKNLQFNHLSVKYNAEEDVLEYDRKLADGPGMKMYGLEVCKSLHLPQEFLECAHQLRMKYNPEQQSILTMSKSHFNAKKIKGLCEMCNTEIGTEVHHLQHQQDADEKGFIGNFHKNNIANLINICEKCHNQIHKSNKVHKKVKTSKGIKIKEIG